jgi:hypothetical protein
LSFLPISPSPTLYNLHDTDPVCVPHSLTASFFCLSRAYFVRTEGKGNQSVQLRKGRKRRPRGTIRTLPPQDLPARALRDRIDELKAGRDLVSRLALENESFKGVDRSLIRLSVRGEDDVSCEEDIRMSVR